MGSRFDWVVEFCADGGQACVLGSRVFPDTETGRADAMKFASLMRDERGHACGPRSVRMRCVEACIESDTGTIYNPNERKLRERIRS